MSNKYVYIVQNIGTGDFQFFDSRKAANLFVKTFIKDNEDTGYSEYDFNIQKSKIYSSWTIPKEFVE